MNWPFHALVAMAFGLVSFVFGVTAFFQVQGAEQRTEAKLQSIRSGVAQPESMVVIRKYVNPGRSGLPHVVLSRTGRPNADIAATRDFFNQVQVGNSLRGYDFADGIFFPENVVPRQEAGKWFILVLGSAMGAISFALARATIRRPGLSFRNASR